MKLHNKILSIFILTVFLLSCFALKPVLNVEAQTGVTEVIYYGFKNNIKTFYIASTETPEILSCTGENDFTGSIAGDADPWTSKEERWGKDSYYLFFAEHIIIQDRVAPTSTAFWFAGMVCLETIDMSKLDTSYVTTMNSMFYDSEIWSVDLSTFNTSNVTNMANMFCNFKVYDHRLDVSNFDTSNVTNIEKMFYSASVDYLDLSSFDLSKVTDLEDDDYNDTFISWTGLVKIETPRNLNISTPGSTIEFDTENWKEGSSDAPTLPINDPISHTYERPYYTLSFEANGGTGTRESLLIGAGDYYYFYGCFFNAPEGKDHNGYWLVNDQEIDYIEEMTSDVVAKPVWVDHNPELCQGYAPTVDTDGLKDCYYCEYCDEYYETVEKSSLILDYDEWGKTAGRIPSFSSQFETFKTTQIANCDSLYSGSDSDVLSLIAQNKSSIDDLVYDSNKSLDENCAVVESKVTALSAEIELTIAKEAAKAEIDTLIDETVSDALKAYVNEQKALIDSATSIEDVAASKTAATSNVNLYKAKNEAKAEIDTLIDETASDALKACVSEQKALIDSATSIEDVAAVKVAAITIIQAMIEKEGNLSVGAVVGIVVGSVVLAILISYAVMFIVWKKNGKGLKFLTPSFKWISKTLFKNE